MGSLSQIPPNVLARILSYPDLGHYVILLWLCGDRQLNNRLMLGGCKSFRTPSWVTRAMKWPRLLADLHGLRSVSFHVKKIEEDLDSVVMEILKLRPLALRKLEITMPGASYITTVLDPVISAKLGRPTLIDLGACFPYLKVLKMQDNIVNPVNTFLVWPNLPISLKRLEWSVSVYSSKFVNRERLQTGNLIPTLLPPGLTSLKFDKGDAAMEVRDVGFLLIALPRTLTHLEGIYLREPKFISLLPRTLKNCDFLRDVRKFTPELALALPPSLESVYCSRFGRRGSIMIDLAAFEAQGKQFEASLHGLLILVLEHRDKEGNFDCNPTFVAFKKLPKTTPQVMGSSFII